mmetsp:Transcript_120513/g.246303  ORF Transcript_120513/g.246303 Transcript_120513/m.246303 type:complete len:116 (+) Transcript_120513:1-348(+)
MGKTFSTEEEVLKLVHSLEREWLVRSYNTLRHNCAHFCDELCQCLGVGPLPEWVTMLAEKAVGIAEAGAGCKQSTQQSCCCIRDSGALEVTEAVTVRAEEDLEKLRSPTRSVHVR